MANFPAHCGEVQIVNSAQQNHCSLLDNDFRINKYICANNQIYSHDMCSRVACRPPQWYPAAMLLPSMFYYDYDSGVKRNTMGSESTPLKIFSIVSRTYSFYHPVLAVESHPRPLELHDHVAVCINKGHLTNPTSPRVPHIFTHKTIHRKKNFNFHLHLSRS